MVRNRPAGNLEKTLRFQLMVLHPLLNGTEVTVETVDRGCQPTATFIHRFGNRFRPVEDVVLDGQLGEQLCGFTIHCGDDLVSSGENALHSR